MIGSPVSNRKSQEKHSRRVGQVEDMILSLYARSMTTRDIQDHLTEIYEEDASPALMSTITDVVTNVITT
ncbi:hypothetical protein GCM10027444_24890 [Actinopolyspora lacussalsi]